MRIVNEANKIIIGYAGENEAVNVLFDVKGWDELYGVGTFTLLNRRPGECEGYPVEVTQEGDTVTWVVSSTDTAIEGIGECELMYIVDNVIAKSVVYNTVISHALCSSDTPPEPWTPWVVTVIEAKDEAVAAKDEIENMTVTANIDDNIGEPAVDVEKTIEDDHVNLDFSFYNLKGQTGATGPQGPQGAGSIVCVDDGNENVTITLESGDFFIISQIGADVPAFDKTFEELGTAINSHVPIFINEAGMISCVRCYFNDASTIVLEPPLFIRRFNSRLVKGYYRLYDDNTADYYDYEYQLTSV